MLKNDIYGRPKSNYFSITKYLAIWQTLFSFHRSLTESDQSLLLLTPFQKVGSYYKFKKIGLQMKNEAVFFCKNLFKRNGWKISPEGGIMDTIL